MWKPQTHCHPAILNSLLFWDHPASPEEFSNHTAECVPLEIWDFLLLRLFAWFCFGLCFPKKCITYEMHPSKSFMGGEGCAVLEPTVLRVCGNWNLCRFSRWDLILIILVENQTEGLGTNSCSCAESLIFPHKPSRIWRDWLATRRYFCYFTLRELTQSNWSYGQHVEAEQGPVYSCAWHSR